jgi:hypothetical protein
MRGQLEQLVVKQSPAGKDVSVEAENIAETRYQATVNEDAEDLACALLCFRERELARAS